MQFRILASVAVLAAATSLGGCASLINPYPTPVYVADSSNSGGHWTPDGSKRSVPDRGLSDARDYGQAWAATYRKASIDHARSKTILSTALVSLSTFGLFTAATRHTDDGSDLMPAIGFGSSGALSLGQLLISAPRQAIYLMGAETMLCAVSRTDPYVMPDAESPLLQPATGFRFTLNQVRPQLLAAIGRASVRMAAAQSEAKKSRKAGIYLEADLKKKSKKLKAADKARKRADADRAIALADNLDSEVKSLELNIAQASGALAEAEKIADELDAYASRRDQAGTQLYSDIQRISAQVDRQIQRTEPDLNAIRQALSTSALASLRDIPALPARKEKNEGGVEALSTFTGRLATSPEEIELVRLLEGFNLALAEATAVRNRLVAAEGKAQASSACQVAGLVGLTIMAPADSLKIGQGELKVSIYTVGGAPSVQIDGSAVGIKSEVLSTDPAHNGFQVRLQADKTAQPGTVRLVARSADGLDTQWVGVKVERVDPPAEQPAPADKSGGGNKTPLDPPGSQAG